MHKISIVEPTVANIQKYKQFKSIYSRVLRDAKKLYFTAKLAENAKNPKKTWETLNEILGKTKQKESLNKINIDDVCDPTLLKLQIILTASLPPLAKKFRMTCKMLACNQRIILTMAVKYLNLY